jgi:hypothetical protein
MAKELTPAEMAAKEWTPEQFIADFPEVVEKLVAERAEKLAIGLVKPAIEKAEAENAKALKAAVETERKRVTDILAISVSGMEAVLREKVISGATLEQAKDAVLEEIRKRTPGTVGDQPPADSLAGLSVEEKAKKEFAAKPELRGEFREEATYIAFRKAEAEGRAKILTSKRAP